MYCISVLNYYADDFPLEFQILEKVYIYINCTVFLYKYVIVVYHRFAKKYISSR